MNNIKPAEAKKTSLKKVKGASCFNEITGGMKEFLNSDQRTLQNNML